MKIPRTIVTVSRALMMGVVLSLSSAFADTVEQVAKETIIPKIEFRDATPADALNAIAQATGLKVFSNFPHNEQTKVSISLTNVPASEAFKYVTGLAHLTLTYEENGVHVTK